ncbi:MAG TPA: RdgB/HAM1 family non-canonical purine NTP pyrophosphatase [Rhizomicrobium sp.]|nr:RdgB/HAM1 family non-canonical purine NTP pyrophosphatase [Rhizomicrobium sp.]
MRFAPGDTLVIASHNPGKVREIREMLAPFALRVVGADTLGLPEPEETGETFSENAILKARAAAKAGRHVALADDSGLSIAALDGAPGIFSARWAGEKKDFRSAMTRVEQTLRAKQATDFSAEFVCALALASPEGETRVFEGRIAGALVFPPRGDKGFGYDPIFVAQGMRETFGEIEPAAKHAMSHRARAFEKLVAGDIFPR